jgi:hypothetical protein
MARREPGIMRYSHVRKRIINAKPIARGAMTFTEDQG